LEILSKKMKCQNMEKEITKTVRLKWPIHERITALAKRAGTDHSSIMRMAITAGIPLVERHMEALFQESATYPIPEITALRMAVEPKKSRKQ
jgi:predicted DNA-binding protein